MSIIIRADFSAAVHRLDDLQKKQVPFAAKNAVNDLARKIIEVEQDEMQTVFQSPTRWTLGSLFIREYATKSNLRAVVDFKDGIKSRSAGKYLAAQIYGGSRRIKAVETFFAKRGLMPEGYRIVPASVRLDSHGNISLSSFKKMVQGVSDGTHFALLQRRGKLSPGLYVRGKRRGKVKALIVYVSQAEYDKRFRYFEVAVHVVQTSADSVFQAELDKALATAR